MGANLGQGSLGYTPGKQPATPATVTGANNGLSLDGTDVQLGQDVGAVGDPAALLNDREIPLSGFFIDLRGTTIRTLIDDANSVFLIQDGVGNDRFLIDNVSDIVRLGDLDSTNNALQLNIDDAGLFAEIGLGLQTSPALYLDFAGQEYTLGDYFGTGNGNGIDIRDVTGFQRVNIGDIGFANNRNLFTVDDLLRRYQMKQGNQQLVFNADITNSLYELGDIAGIVNGTFLSIDDATGVFSLKNSTNNSSIKINGIAGFTGTVSPVNSITVVGGIVTAVS